MGKDNANIIKILAKHLKKLSKAGLKDFIVALCNLEPPKGYSQIQRNHLEEKTAMQMTKFIMKIYTNRYGPAKVREALKNIHENQIRTNLEKELREESKTTKSTVKVETSGGGANRKRVEGEQRKNYVKPKRSQRPNTESQTIKSIQKAETSGGAANRKRVGKKNRGKDVKPKRTRRQSTSVEKHFVNQYRNKLINRITDVDPVLDDLLGKELLTQEQYDIIRGKKTSQDKMRELYHYVRSWLGLEENYMLLEILKEHNPVVIKNLLKEIKSKTKK